jgi:hypothetical protein
MTYAAPFSFATPNLHSYFGPLPLEAITHDAERIGSLSEFWLNHRFDLLGSGWVRVTYGMRCRGLHEHRYESGPTVTPDGEGHWLEGRVRPPNIAESRRVWRFIKGEYVPIDWHLDFKSGYRWSERTWYRDVKYGHAPGADIKAPWELARMEHLPQIALAHALSARHLISPLRPPEVYAAEFRNQVLDFIATNAPRWGVNWASTMDVAIRVSNWLVAHDLLREHGASFDADFSELFARSVYEHGCHILENLEWTPELHANHYLASVVGLLFVAAYLPRNPETDAWLAFAVQELVAQVYCQFTPDGACFEGSTSYHRLSAELVVYGSALTLALPAEKLRALQTYDHRLIPVGPRLAPAPLPFYPGQFGGGLTPFPEWYFERLERMAEFTMHATKPSGRVPQIGDNDSGRFLRLRPDLIRRTVGEAKRRYANLAGYAELSDDAFYWDRDDLDHHHLVAAISGLFVRPDFEEFAGPAAWEGAMIRSVTHNRRFPSYLKRGACSAAEAIAIGNVSVLDHIMLEFGTASPDHRQSLDIPAPGGDLCNGLKTFAYPHFGLFVFCSRRLYLAVRCGPVGHNGIGVHTHNDQLSLELALDGEDLMRDPGTYVYTPLPELRNAYRSMRAHFGPQIEGPEPGRLDLGLFQLGSPGRAECLYFGREGFAGVWRGRRRAVHSMVRLSAYAVMVRHVAHGCRLVQPGAPIRAGMSPQVAFSQGYGRLLTPQAD